MTGVAFVVPGEPVPAARPRVTKHGAYTPARTRNAEGAVRLLARKARGPGKPTPKGSRWSVRILASHATAVRADVDNVAKTVLDGMTGVVWEDDDQVVDLHIMRIQVARGAAQTSVVAYLLDDTDPLI